MKRLLFLFYMTATLLINGQNLLTNGDFVTPLAGWTTSGDFSFNTNFSIYNFDIGYAYTSQDPHDVGILYQSFYIPANISSATLEFYTRITTNENPIQAYDVCDINIYELGGANLHQFTQLSNLDDNSSYQHYSYSIPSSFFGKNVVLEFNFDNDGLTSTRFRFDNISVTTTTSGGGGGNNLPDYTVSNQSIDVSSITAGNSIDVDCDHNHSGTYISGPNVKLGYYLSTDQIVSNDDHFFSNNIDNSNLSFVGDSDPESENLDIPSSTPQGQYYILWYTDYDNQYTESNENNNVESAPLFVYSTAPPAPTVTITSPSQYMCISTGSSMLIEADITGAITGKEISYSPDGGLTWYFIWGISTTNTDLSFTWQIPNYFLEPQYILFKVKVFSQSGNVEDVTFFPCQIIPPTSPFELNSNGISHIYWPIEIQDYSWSYNQRWLITRGHGIVGHIGMDYYALDFAKHFNFATLLNDLFTGNFNNIFVCNREMYAPFNFKLIRKHDNYPDDCDNQIDSSISGAGNYIIIQSAQNENFAFFVGHLNYVNDNLQEGIIYPKETLLGEIGSTGNSTGPHAHCVLYKNIMDTFEYVDAGGAVSTISLYEAFQLGLPFSSQFFTNEMKQKYAARFIFDAHYNGGSGGSASVKGNNQNFQISFFPNPTTGMLYLNSDFEYHEIDIFDIRGKLVKTVNYSSEEYIDLTELSNGTYLVSLRGDSIRTVKKIVKTD